ncbi:MAG: indolepyruvate ferredoxin oxidoreductase subunit alpha [Methanohalobium sp.]|uniref:indolepyruvate ferredoxin oxidoreductase subunit alpha n=1 Tax=Methanohalobium sp. TaxID=2837493 RepID=UPI00397BE871
MNTREYMLGNVAIARGILEGGGQVITGYPGTPSSEIVDTLSSMDNRDFYVEWSVNEKVAMEVAAGASMSGVNSAVTMKHVGLNVAADPLMTLAYMGVKGGMIIIVADDPACHSSQNEQDTRRYSQFSLIPCLEPSTPQEAKDMIPYAFDFSSRHGIPVIFRSTTRISHGKSDIELGPILENKPAPGFEKSVERWVMIPKNARIRHPSLLNIQGDIKQELQDSKWNELTINNDSNFGIVASGISYVYAKEALDRLGVEASVLKINTYPEPDGLILEILENVDTLLVIEELEPVVEEHVRALANDFGVDVRILGKTGKNGEFVPRVGELNIDKCERAINSALGLTYNKRPSRLESDIKLPSRPPAMCPGCSHRASYYAMKKAFGSDAIYPNDIGCYTLGVQGGTVDTTLCMGASISVASGIYQSGEKKPICCAIGDSTFLHTGINSLMNAVYNKADITVTILDNRVTAMTGHQPNPGMGKTATYENTVEISFEHLCKSLGTEFVEVVDPYDYNRAVEVFKRAKEYGGTSVVISQQQCVIDARRAGIKRKPYTIDKDKCTGCKQCVYFGCPAIEFDASLKKARINSMCTGCGVCAQLCKFDAIMEVKK